jgi:hypothetical protein
MREAILAGSAPEISNLAKLSTNYFRVKKSTSRMKLPTFPEVVRLAAATTMRRWRMSRARTIIQAITTRAVEVPAWTLRVETSEKKERKRGRVVLTVEERRYIFLLLFCGPHWFPQPKYTSWFLTIAVLKFTELISFSQGGRRLKSFVCCTELP